MAVSKVTRAGVNLILHMDDGSRSIAYRAHGALWYPRGATGPGPDPDPHPDPDEFNMISNDGTLEFTINKTGIGYARTIFDVGADLGLPRDAVVAAFMCVMVEAPPFLMYANSTIPESLDYPHDAVGSDSDSLGLFQQRPSAGWGSVAELMDAEYNARAFFGGPTGPNYPSPAGLLDISPPWDERATLGEAVQAVQVSAFPDRYDNWSEACYDLYDALAEPPEPSGEFAWHYTPTPQDEGGDMPPNGSGDQPLAEFGPRNLTGSMHEGIDFGYGRATLGATNRATGAGEVVIAGVDGGWGNSVVIFHGTMDYDGTQKDIYTRHAHMSSLSVSVGDTVALGDGVGILGSTGNVTGPHDHYETHVCEPGQPMVNNINDPNAFRTAVNPRDFHAIMGDDVQP